MKINAVNLKLPIVAVGGIMDKTENSSLGSEQYFGRLLIAMELRRTHGMLYAVSFIEEFEEQIYIAVARNLILLKIATEGKWNQ